MRDWTNYHAPLWFNAGLVTGGVLTYLGSTPTIVILTGATLFGIYGVMGLILQRVKRARGLDNHPPPR